MSNKPVEALREGFDAWWREQFEQFDFGPHEERYTDQDEELAWLAWQAHAAEAAQQAAEPVAAVECNANGQIRLATPSGDAFDMSRYVGARFYTHPQPAQDAKDAARYRFAQTHDGFAVCRWDEAAGPERDGEYIPIDDEDVDAAMAKESGQ